MERRRAILGAALEAYEATGATPIDEVRRRSGASIGSIYHHFGGKDGIAAALYVDVLRDYQQGFLRALRRTDRAEAGIKALVRHHLRWVQSHPAEARFLLYSRVEAGDELRALNRELFAEVTAWLETQTEVRDLSRDAFYAVVIGPAQEASRHWLGGRMKSLRPLEAELGEAAWRAIREEPQ